MRLDIVSGEYTGRVRLVERAFPLEVYGGGPPDRHGLEQEWWLAAIQEPAAQFRPYTNDIWPISTLPAFEAVWCARQIDYSFAHQLDLRIRRAFFAESANMSDRSIYPLLAGEFGIDVPEFLRLFNSDLPRTKVLEEGRLGFDKLYVRETPTIMLPDATKLILPMAQPDIPGDRVISVQPLPCCGESCYQLARDLFERAAAGPDSTAGTQH